MTVGKQDEERRSTPKSSALETEKRDLKAAAQRVERTFIEAGEQARARLSEAVRGAEEALLEGLETLREQAATYVEVDEDQQSESDDMANPAGSPETPMADKVRGMTGEITREEIAASLAAVEARTDTKMAVMNGRLDLIVEKLDGVREGQRASFWGLIGALGAAVAVVIGCLAFGSQWFDLGLDSGAAMEAAAQRGAERAITLSKDAATAQPPPTPAPKTQKP